MPVAKIHVRKSRSADEKEALMAAVRLALTDALGTPERACQFLYVAYSPEDFAIAPERTDNFTLIEITLFAGRSPEAKKKLYREIVQNLGALGIEPLDVFVILLDVPLENWGIRGGVPASEVDLGYKVNV